MKTAIIEYNAGNIRSVDFALRRIGVNALITGDPEEIQQAEKVIFPGVGSAYSTMKYLQKKGLTDVIRNLTQPVLGICLGMQLLCKTSEEGKTDCLDLIPATVKRFNGDVKIPHIGWNRIESLQGDIFQNVTEGSFVYFVHSYFVPDGDYAIARTEYSGLFAAALKKDNFYATQFHPEKSGNVGAQILKNFLAL
jgi:glutamine amidotransferase